MEEELEYYVKAGEVVKHALDYAYRIVKSRKRVKIYDLCQAIENFIVKAGARNAFPCNICVNEVAAHYTPFPEDEEYIPNYGIVKIDVGAHINGYIADAAISIPLSEEFKDIVDVNREILSNVIDNFRPGVKLGEIGGLIYKLAKKHGYKTIENLTGHLISRYLLHAGKYVPNIPQRISERIVEGEVYAIEPFLTFQNGSGRVVESTTTRIYSLIRFKKIKNDTLEMYRKYIYSKFNRLPFTPRWLYTEFRKEKINQLIQEMVRKNLLRAYPVLVEEKKAIVSQFEHTVIVLKKEVVVVT